jgi:5-methylcytosine-specific restriction protein B
MNTADKSIALLDIALRRRFEFEAMYPDYEIEGLKNSDKLEQLNGEIIKEKGHDFQIGHSYFMGNDSLENKMNKKVIPLLMEYFMNDEDAVKKILGSCDFNIASDSFPLKIKL